MWPQMQPLPLICLTAGRPFDARRAAHSIESFVESSARSVGAMKGEVKVTRIGVQVASHAWSTMKRRTSRSLASVEANAVAAVRAELRQYSGNANKPN